MRSFFMHCTAAALLFAAAAVRAEVKLDDCFGDNMVIQRELPARFRGTADPGEKVTVEFAGQKVEATADKNGDWLATLAPLKANKKTSTLKVSGEKNSVTLKNILVGEVWLCTGQSNMFYRVFNRGSVKNVHRDGEKISAEANCPLIRIAMVPLIPSANLERGVKMQWQPVTPKNICEFSAVGYFFGLELFKAIDVPIGLVRSCWGGTRIEPWTTRDGFESVPEGKGLANFIAARTGGTPEFEKNTRAYLNAHDKWLQKASAEVAKGRVPAPPPATPVLYRAAERTTPGALYNAMIHPLTGMTVRGAIWYQGESNLNQWYHYRWQMHALVNGWKKAFDNPAFQFHFVQIAPYRYSYDTPRICTGLWEAQQRFADESGCGMAVVNDYGNPDDIHPNDKRPVGHRLALLALNRTYGRKDVRCDAPRVAGWKVEGRKFVLDFKDVDRWSTTDGKAPRGFEVAGIDGRYFPAQAELEGNRISVSAAKVPAPRYLRYLGHNVDCGNLRNEQGLVPAPFRLAEPNEAEELAYLTGGRPGLIYRYNLFSGFKKGRMLPDIDNSANFAKRKLVRIHYLAVLKTRDGKNLYADISFDPFTKDLRLVGIPGSKLRRNIAGQVRNIRIRGNVPDLIPDDEIRNGGIEFFHTSYSPQNIRGVRYADDKLFDAGDRPNANGQPGYGCLQIHSSRGEPIFCFNNFKAGKNSDIGFGRANGRNPDWTFSRSGRNYSSAMLYVFGEFK